MLGLIQKAMRKTYKKTKLNDYTTTLLLLSLLIAVMGIFIILH
ncbi:MAG: hypothetical protein JWQ54_3312 [Mucilaginibacter sp.]|jgi:hypothetical protein|nr:hypothetical protein [Mucilaginibacter sp.]